MDIALGVSMTPTTVRMVLVEGEKADGVTVDHDAFDIQTGEGAATAADQVVAAILGTRESAAEGGHRLVSTGVTWTDHAAAAGLRDALAARKIDDVVLVSELHAAGALAQAVGQTVGYDRTALMFLERDTATVSVVDTATGYIVKVQTEHLHAQDAVAELQRMIAGLEAIPEPPQGVFVLGSGVDVAAVKSQLALGTMLPVHAPDEAELALARGAALASATAPRYDASTVGLAYAQDPDGTTAGKVYPAAGVYPAGASTEMSEAGTQMAAAGYMAPLGYSEVLDDMDGDLGYDSVPYDSVPEELDFAPDDSGRKPFLLVGSALTSIFVVGVVALVISLAVSIRPTVDQRPSPAEAVIVPSSQPAGPVAEQAAPPAPPSAPSVPDTIQEPIPVVQQAPRTVFVTPAPQAPAPAPAAPAPAPEAPAPAPEAPAPAPAPIAPVIPAPILPPPIIVLPQPILPPFLRPPRPRDYPTYPSSPNYPSYPSSPPQTPTYPSSPPTQQPSTPPTQQQPPSQQPQAPVTEAPSNPPPAAGGSGGYGGGSGGYGGGSGGYGGGSGSGSSSGSDGGSRSGDSGGSRSGRGSQNPLWPFPSFGH
ncbi:hypothetical protein MAIC_51590 [Mycolicibacterium aichiense]|uniref:DUF7159 domain-containing protein n=2 Tax=Mycolicibacterium aichiense TaxID=1799 RepID=A0AAD1HX07_9MYCO|nr:hypothetical protein [Mycolicibacterium aichiense]MCV7017216.1 hypothetical protein [Mycolicibacterium aichiense]BBX10356.1 hypothetical protein MAIC_51590 [Mycolicibacterium aichiense]STZ25986.1 membrane protein [Mycolicibacterium aichiense]